MVNSQIIILIDVSIKYILNHVKYFKQSKIDGIKQIYRVVSRLH